MLLYLSLRYDSESITSFWVQNVLHLTNHLAEHTLLWVASSYATARSVMKYLNTINYFLYILLWAFTTTFVLKNIPNFSKAYFGFILTLLHIKVQGWSFVLAVKTTTASSAEGGKNQRLVECQLSLNLKATVSEHTWYSPQEQDTQENWGFKWAST